MVAELLYDWFETNGVLHQGKMGSRKQRSCIDTVARVINRVEQAWDRGNFAALLLTNFKGEFDHVSRNCLLRRLKEIGVDGNLVGWVGSFVTERRLQLRIDGHCRTKAIVKLVFSKTYPFHQFSLPFIQVLHLVLYILLYLELAPHLFFG